MSNYTIAVNWSGKDALSDSDAAKVISGSDFNTEFTTVRTAVNSKADTNGDSGEDFAANNTTVAGTLAVTGNVTGDFDMVGTPTVPTQSAGNNTTRAASTAFVTAAVAAVDKAVINGHAYPVGSIFTSVVATNPATLLGVGTWAVFGAGKVMVGIDASDTDFDTVLETGGAKTHTLSIAEMPAHTHNVDSQGGEAGSTQSLRYGQSNTTKATSSTGGGSAHNILQPYIVVYMWRRTA